MMIYHRYCIENEYIYTIVEVAFFDSKKNSPNVMAARLSQDATELANLFGTPLGLLVQVCLIMFCCCSLSWSINSFYCFRILQLLA
jgi:hypothetical protein